MTDAAITEFVDGRLRDIFERSAGESFDQTHMARPPSSRNYVICFEERSGSTMLCRMLAKTGVLGDPDEFLNPRGPMLQYLAECNAHDLDEFIGYLRRTYVSSNGVFGLKTCHPDFVPLLDQRTLERLIDPVKFIYLTREDALRQAVSSALARSTGLWHVYDGEQVTLAGATIKLNEQLVLEMVEKLRSERALWQEYFAASGAQVLRLSYEELVREPRGVVRRIANYVEVDVDEARIPEQADTQRMATEVNEKWVRSMRKRFAL